jgi:sulfur carrier protein
VLHINGKVIEYEDSMKLNALLEFLEVSNQPCAVEVNSTLVPHADRDNYTLNEGDNIEIVTLVGGG